MRYELTIRSNERGLSRIIIRVPRGRRDAGLDLIDRAMPAIRDLARLLRPRDGSATAPRVGRPVQQKHNM